MSSAIRVAELVSYLGGMGRPTTRGFMKTIRDAVHGDIRLSADEIRLIDTVEFQRLRGIKQLGTTSLVYPSAVHTRFEHSLGTAWITKRLIDALVRQGASIDADEASSARLAALLHDITHVPFGHTFEDERRLLDKHDADQSRLNYFLVDSALGKILHETPAGDRVVDLLSHGQKSPPFVGQLVKGTICADLLDYLKRDAFHCGLKLAYDDRLEDYFGIEQGQLVVRLHKQGRIRQDVLTELIHLLQLRYTLTERVYYHHAKVAAGAMISRGVELAFASGHWSPATLFDLRDDSLLDRLAALTGSIDGMKDLIHDLASRRLYGRAYLLEAEGLRKPGLTKDQQETLALQFHHQPAYRREIESRLAKRLGIPESHIIIYCPSPEMQLKEADVPVEFEPGRVEPLSALGHPDVESLTMKHRGLWRFLVLVRRGDEELLERAGRLSEEEIGYANQLVGHHAGPLRRR
ncbi:HD domain-containing protein [bacterium]|nr:HD domain-containing protein [bacterium]